MQKFIKLTFIMALAISGLSMSACTKEALTENNSIQSLETPMTPETPQVPETPVNPQNSQLPQYVQQFIDTYFAGSTVLRWEKDGNEYEVTLQNGFEVEFDHNGEWKDVDCRNSAVPQGIVPGTILNYVNQNYPTCFIVEIHRDRHGYEVELNNGLELEFDKNGGFLHVDY